MDLPVFQIERLTNLLKGACTEWQFKFTAQTESTNSDLKLYPAQMLEKPFLLITDEQLGGRGQLSKKWAANPGENILCSIALKPKKSKGLQLLGLLTAVSIVEAISKLNSSIQAEIKWPNDVLINGKKVAGILVETQYVANSVEKVIIGFGLNVNQALFDGELKKSATSLLNELNRKTERESLLASILNTFAIWYELWEDEDPAILSAIHSKLIGFETYINLRKVGGKILHPKVWFLGVDMNGRLGILDENGEHKWFEHEQLRVERI
jgi:BirA family biotin operon repressor/biotin-[acetyl-CoA-carboxylase] ligase